MSKKKSHQQYVDEVKIINPNIDVIEHYIGSKTLILHKCKKDGYEWKAKPTNILNGTGCPMCAGNIQKTHDQYIKDVHVSYRDLKREQYFRKKDKNYLDTLLKKLREKKFEGIVMVEFVCRNSVKQFLKDITKLKSY